MVMVRSWVRWVGLFAWSSYISATMGGESELRDIFSVF